MTDQPKVLHYCKVEGRRIVFVKSPNSDAVKYNLMHFRQL